MSGQDAAPTSTALRLAIAVPGVLLAGYGVLRLVTQVDAGSLLRIAVWLVAAVVVHDGVLAPAVGLAGVALDVVPRRARRYLQGAVVTGLLVGVVALPIVYRARHRGPRQKALLEQDYGANLVVLLTLVAASAALLYAVRVVRDERRRRTLNDRPDASQDAAGS